MKGVKERKRNKSKIVFVKRPHIALPPNEILHSAVGGVPSGGDLYSNGQKQMALNWKGAQERAEIAFLKLS